MTSFAHPGGKHVNGPPATGVDTQKHSGDNSLSVAKLGLIGSLGAAVLTTATTIFVTSHPDPKDPQVTAAAAITPVRESPLVSVDQVNINDSESQVAVAGSVTGSVQRVYVTIGPRQAGGQVWAAWANVEDQRWQLVVDTDPHLVRPYEITAIPKNPYGGGVSAYAFHNTTTPTAPSDPQQDVNCAVQNGDTCFAGPGFGPPSVYRGQ